jgi:hypothetical protein
MLSGKMAGEVREQLARSRKIGPKELIQQQNAHNFLERRTGALPSACVCRPDGSPDAVTSDSSLHFHQTA